MATCAAPASTRNSALIPREGLSNVLTGELLWQDVVIPIEGKPNLTLLPSGPGSHRAADLIGPRLSSLLDEFGKEYDLVILDSPPLLGFAECLQIAAAADGVVIVSRAAETKRKAVAAVISALKRLRANIVGVVLNQVSQNTSPTATPTTATTITATTTGIPKNRKDDSNRDCRWITAPLHSPHNF